MPRSPRVHVQERPLMDICNRTVQGLSLLSPDGTFNALVVGALAKAQEDFPVALHGGAMMGDHWHLLITPDDVEQQAGFVGAFTRRLSLIAGRRHDWQGPIFVERYKALEVSAEDEAQVRRLKYVLSNGCKEGLVSSPLEWPGVPFAAAMLGDRVLKGLWIDREALYEARRRGEQVSELDFAEEVEVVLEPLPCWAHLSRDAYGRAVRELIDGIEAETAASHAVEGTSPAGAEAVRSANPWTRRTLEKVVASSVSAASTGMWKALLDGYQDRVTAYRVASERFRSGLRDTVFPPNCFPPALPFVPAGSSPGVPAYPEDGTD